MARIAIGRSDEVAQFGALKIFISEFLATFIFIFAGKGSTMAYSKIAGGEATASTGLIIAALAYGLSLVAGVSVGANNSGGHVNPAVTLGVFLGGHVTLFRGIILCVAQVLGSIVACVLLKFSTGGMAVSAGAPSGISASSAVVFEVVMTFGLVYTVYATAVDPNKGSLRGIAPIVIGFIVGANILAGGPFSGGSMNPAAALGPALVSGQWASQWIYWVGPLIGGGLAGLVYDFLYISDTHEPLPSSADF